MVKSLSKIQNFILDLLFPKFCINCKKEGEYLCQDCQALLDISEFNYCLCEHPLRMPDPGKCKRCFSKKLNGLFSAVPYQNALVQKMIKIFKYEPYAKELAKPLSSLILAHFELIEKNFGTLEYSLIPVPLHKKRLKQRGFNQAEEIGKILSESLGIPLLKNILIRVKETLPQAELKAREREENIKGAFAIIHKNSIERKKILLVDDVYTTGATLEECAKILKFSGVKEVWGITVARE